MGKHENSKDIWSKPLIKFLLLHVEHYTIIIMYISLPLLLRSYAWMRLCLSSRKQLLLIISDSTHHFFRNACAKSGVITVFIVFRLLTDFVCLYKYEFLLSRCKIVQSSVILLLPLYTTHPNTCLFVGFYIAFHTVFYFSRKNENVIQTWPLLPTVYTINIIVIRRSCNHSSMCHPIIIVWIYTVLIIQKPKFEGQMT